jgi:uncharacterized lipoprotein NlpE involved in copper resistance
MKETTISFSRLIAALIIFGLGACRSTQEAVDTDISGKVYIHNPRISVDWTGLYTGTIPAADAPGIDVFIWLYNDDTCFLRYCYVDRPGSEFFYKGPFKWNDAGNIITLDVKDVPPFYLVGENRLTQLDMKGKVITGNLAENYVLKKGEQPAVCDF